MKTTGAVGGPPGKANRHRGGGDADSDAEPSPEELTAWEAGLKDHCDRGSEDLRTAFSARECGPSALRRLGAASFLGGRRLEEGGLPLYDDLNKANLHLLLGAYSAVKAARRRREMGDTTEFVSDTDRCFLRWLVRKARELRLVNSTELRRCRIATKRVEMMKKSGNFSLALEVNQAEPSDAETQEQRRQHQAEREELGTADVRFPERKASSSQETTTVLQSRLRSRNTNRMAGITVSSSHNLDMQRVREQLLAPKLSFDWEDKGEEEDQDLEVEVPEHDSQSSTRDIFRDQLRRSVSFHQAKALGRGDRTNSSASLKRAMSSMEVGSDTTPTASASTGRPGGATASTEDSVTPQSAKADASPAAAFLGLSTASTPAEAAAGPAEAAAAAAAPAAAAAGPAEAATAATPAAAVGPAEEATTAALAEEVAGPAEVAAVAATPAAAVGPAEAATTAALAEEAAGPTEAAAAAAAPAAAAGPAEAAAAAAVAPPVAAEASAGAAVTEAAAPAAPAAAAPAGAAAVEAAEADAPVAAAEAPSAAVAAADDAHAKAAAAPASGAAAAENCVAASIPAAQGETGQSEAPPAPPRSPALLPSPVALPSQLAVQAIALTPLSARQGPDYVPTQDWISPTAMWGASPTPSGGPSAIGAGGEAPGAFAKRPDSFEISPTLPFVPIEAAAAKAPGEPLEISPTMPFVPLEALPAGGGQGSFQISPTMPFVPQEALAEQARCEEDRAPEAAEAGEGGSAAGKTSENITGTSEQAPAKKPEAGAAEEDLDPDAKASSRVLRRTNGVAEAPALEKGMPDALNEEESPLKPAEDVEEVVTEADLKRRKVEREWLRHKRALDLKEEGLSRKKEALTAKVLKRKAEADRLGVLTMSKEEQSRYEAMVGAGDAPLLAPEAKRSRGVTALVGAEDDDDGLLGGFAKGPQGRPRILAAVGLRRQRAQA